MSGYSKRRFADELGISKEELEDRAEENGFDSTEEYWNYMGGWSWQIIKDITDHLIALDKQLDDLAPLGITQEDKDNFLINAEELIAPYYNEQKDKYEAGIKEGEVRSAEDTLLFMRDFTQGLEEKIKDLDLSQAETEEQFLETLGRITSTRDEDVANKTLQWKQNLEDLKAEQVRKGIFSSGIGLDKRVETQGEAATDIAQTEAEAQRLIEQAETAQDYSLEEIRLARIAAEQEKLATIGTDEEAAATQEGALGTLGLGSITGLGTKAEIDQARAQANRNISIYQPEDLKTLEGQRLAAKEAKAQELETQELAVRNQEYETARKKILSEQNDWKNKLRRYGREWS